MPLGRALLLLLLACSCNRDVLSGEGACGSTWTKIDTGTTEDLKGIWGDGEVIYVVGNKATLRVSRDGGRSWQPEPIDAGDEDLLALWGRPGATYVAGRKRVLLKEDDRPFRALGSLPYEVGSAGRLLPGIALSGGLDGLVVFGCHVYHAEDHQLDWEFKLWLAHSSIGGLLARGNHLLLLHSSLDSEVTPAPGFAASTDGGRSWDFPGFEGVPGRCLRRTYPYSKGHSLSGDLGTGHMVILSEGDMAETLDGGATWSCVQRGGYSVAATNDIVVIASDSKIHMRRSSDGTWQETNVSGSVSAAWAQGSCAVLAGENGTLYVNR